MSVKQDLIKLLEEKRGQYISGEDLASYIGVTRAAVWKAIKSLKNDGFVIDAVTNKGYMLHNDSDAISMVGIKRYLNVPELNVEIYNILESTNQYMRCRVEEQEGLVVIAREQSAGIARNGKQFFSPKDTGIYFSVLLKPDKRISDPKELAKMAGEAVKKAIKIVCDEDAEIRGLNDIYLSDKKVCGMLTQASYNVEEERVEYVIIGMGINIYPPDNGFPQAIEAKVGPVLINTKGNYKNRLVAEILNEFWKKYKRG